MTTAAALGPAAAPRNRPLQLLRRYPLLAYFLLAYAFTWTYDLLFLILFPLPDVPGRNSPRDYGPAVAALVVTAATAGRPGVRRLLRRLVLWRVHPGWYLFALLGIPALYTLGVLLVPGALASFTMPSPAGWLLYPGLAVFLYAVVFGGPLGEEPGWRGFALPRLQARWGPLAGALILGLLWAGWHAPEYLTPDFAATNGGLTLRGVGVFVLALISFSIIITWVFNHTRGSLLLAILVHTAINWSQVLTSALFPAAGTNEVGPLVVFGLAALALVVATRGRLGYDRAGGEAGAVSAEPSEPDRVLA
ncbi:MAG TPA: CPBP family intramembrane glutamic endopeptidase [Vicinamibacteria bacterium]